jgi:tetratricopeptide (TPR) repeat protein
MKTQNAQEEIKKSIFISYKFDEEPAEQLKELVTDTIHQIRRLTVVDGKTLDLAESFSTSITDYIIEHAGCLIAIFTKGDHRNSNVLYEVGVAVGSRKKVVLVAESIDVIPSMLKMHPIIAPKTKIAWFKEFQATLEKRLRVIFQLPEDHFIENKLRRRYSSEERRHMKDPDRMELPISCIRVGDLKKAEPILRRRLDADSRDLDAIFLLSETYYLEGCSGENPQARVRLFRKQLALAERGLKINPYHVLCLSSKAAAHMRLGQYDYAENALEKLVSIDPSFSVGHYNAACLAALVGNKERMIHHLSTAISNNAEWRGFAKEDPDFTGYFHDADWQGLVYEL